MFDATYNITNIQDGKIEIDIKIAGGKRMALSDIVEIWGPPLGRTPETMSWSQTKNSLI